MQIRRSIRRASNREGNIMTLAHGVTVGRYTVRGKTLVTPIFHAIPTAPVDISQVAATNAVSSIHMIPTSKAAHKWVQANQASVLKHRGKWVAITGKGITASNASLERTRELARAKGAENPVVFQVPSEPRGMRVVSSRRR